MKAYLQAFLSNDKRVIQHVYSESYNRLLPVVRSSNGSSRDAKGVVEIMLQVMFDKAHADPANFPPDAYFLNYFFKACRNRWSNIAVRAPKLPTELIDFTDKQVTFIDEDSLDGMEHLVLENEQWAMFYHHLARLGPRCRQLLDWLFDGVKMKEIATNMQWASEQVAKNEVGKCRKKLDQKIKRDPLYPKFKHK